MAGIFEGFDVNTDDLKSANGPAAGPHEAVISASEIRDDVYKQGNGDKFWSIDFMIQGFEYPKTLNLAMPVQGPWDDTVPFTTLPSGTTFTEKQSMTKRLTDIKKFLVNLGVPDNAESLNSVSPDDLIGFKGVLTLVENKKGYVNPTKFVVKNDTGIEVPDSKIETEVEVPSAGAAPTSSWGV